MKSKVVIVGIGLLLGSTQMYAQYPQVKPEANAAYKEKTAEANKLEQAKQMLRELAETSNAVQSNEIFDMAEEQGISKRTLENAKKELGIRARKINNSWYWELDKIK
jgi:hypothetical protein